MACRLLAPPPQPTPRGRLLQLVGGASKVGRQHLASANFGLEGSKDQEPAERPGALRLRPFEARRGPVYITDRGRPAHVLLTYEDYQRLAGGETTIVDLLGEPAGVEDAELDSPDLADRPRPAELA